MYTIVDYCDRSYKEKSEENCNPCSHPTECPNDCETCLEQVHYPLKYPNGRRDYNCALIVNFYTCKYIFKYASEIEYALMHIPYIDDFTEIHMLSIGCGPSPDLLAVQHYVTENDLDIPIKYIGFDHNILWIPLHNKIKKRASRYGINKVKYYYKDVIDHFSEKSVNDANILILQYILSHMNNEGRANEIKTFFNGLVSNVILKMQENSIIILNDINHNSVRGLFKELHNVIIAHGRDANITNYYFEHNINNEAKRFGTRHNRKSVIFNVPENITDSYNPWMNCTSAQSIIQLGR